MTDTLEPTERTMTGAEFRCLREHLGLTNAWLADHLGVAERSVVRWGDGVMAPPPGVVADMLALEENAASAVGAAVALLHDMPQLVWTTWRTDDALHAANPDDQYTAAWHRAIAWRVRERVPAVRIEFAAE